MSCRVLVDSAANACKTSVGVGFIISWLIFLRMQMMRLYFLPAEPVYNICCGYALNMVLALTDITYNAEQSIAMIISCKEDRRFVDMLLKWAERSNILSTMSLNNMVLLTRLYFCTPTLSCAKLMWRSICSLSALASPMLTYGVINLQRLS